MEQERVFSPTQTADWSQCPRLWAVTRVEKWQKTGAADRRLIAALLGTAVATGLAVYNKTARVRGWAYARTMPHVVHAAVTAAVHRFTRELTVLEARGVTFEVLAHYGDVGAVLAATIPKVITGDSTPSSWRVLAVEQGVPHAGYARADVVYETPTGERIVRDYKFTMALQPRYASERLEDYTNHPQGYHYLWAWGATTFIPTLVVANPFKLYETPRLRTPQELDTWLTGQRAKWAVMAAMHAGTVPIWGADTHKTPYGKCPLYEWCLEYGADPTRLPLLGWGRVVS
jgi:hypothetical protein